MEPNSSITLSGSNAPKYYSTLQCTDRSWTIEWVGATPAPYITAKISPSTTGSGTNNCSYIDNVNIQITTDGTVPDDPAALKLQIKAHGAWQLCPPPCTNNVEDAADITFMPGLHIKDVALNKHVENTTVSHVAGQFNHIKPELDNFAMNGPKGCTWTMPGYFSQDALMSYVTANTATSASPVPSTPIPAPVANGTYDVAWYNARSETPSQVKVICDIKDGGTTDINLTAVAQLGFETPQPKITVHYPSVVDNWTTVSDPNCVSHTGLYLEFGGGCIGATPPPGINWTYSINATDAAEQGGVIGLWQIVNSSKVINQFPNPANNYSATCTNMADSQVPYATSQSGTRGSTQAWNVSGGWYDADGPGYLNVQGATYSEVDDTFDDYLMYKPQDSGADGRSSIWVSLGHFHWGIQANEKNPVAGMHPTVVYQTPAPALDTTAASPSFPGSC